MAKRKLIVHIGPAKTGSTSIQHMLHALAPSLEQCGVHAVVASSDRGNHWHLSRGESERRRRGLDNPSFKDPRYRWSYVLHELSRCRAEQFLLSSEWFALPDTQTASIRRLSCLESRVGVEVDVIAYVRPQWRWAESFWHDDVSAGYEVRRFEECREEGPIDPRLDYNQVFRPWRESFAKVTVSPLEPSRLPRGLLVHFLGLIGIDDERLFRAAARLPRLNRRSGAKELEVRRLVGMALARQGVEYWDRPAFMRRLGDLTHLLHEDWPFAGVTRAQALALNSHFAESNARFARDYGIDEDGTLFRDEIPQDLDSRGRPAYWEDLSDSERRAVREHVSRTVGIDIERGVWLDGNAVVRGRPAERRRNPSRLARRLSRRWDQGKQVFEHALRLTRALAQIRVSRSGLLFARWVCWEVYDFWWQRLRIGRRRGVKRPTR